MSHDRQVDRITTMFLTHNYPIQREKEGYGNMQSSKANKCMPLHGIVTSSKLNFQTDILIYTIDA